MLQSDISIGNLMMNDNHSWRAFLIDLDLAIKEQLDESSGARGKIGTRAFMAIGVLLEEKHSFKHDLVFSHSVEDLVHRDYRCW